MGAAAPPCGRNSRPYDVIAFFFLLDFFIIGLAALVALPPLAKQSAIAAD